VAIVAAIERDLIAKCTQYKVLNGIFRSPTVIASEAKQSSFGAEKQKAGLLRRKCSSQ
jgi:hypothetical protein